MRRSPTPHLTRKRVAPHPGYRWRWYELEDGTDVRVKEFAWTPKNKVFAQHRERRRLGFNRADYAAFLLERARLERIAWEKFVVDLEDFAMTIPDRPRTASVIMASPTVLDELERSFKRS
ncbi:MAG TPA: hypothetical protein PLB89_04900 [Flavobacteriales bacterium]|nr:hypothetical protein [Flavobacteriales bacterium]